MFALHVAAVDLLRRLRDPWSFLLWLGIPLAIATMIHLAFGGGGSDGPSFEAEVLVVDEDGSFLSGLFVSALEGAGEGSPFHATAVELAEGEYRIGRGDASALLVIPAGFGSAVLSEQPCELRLLKNPVERIVPGIVEGALEIGVDGVFYAHRLFGDAIDSALVPPEAGAATLPDADVAHIATTVNAAVERLSTLLFPPAISVEFGDQDAPAESGDAGVGGGFGEAFFPSMLFMCLFFLAGGISEDVWVERRLGTLRRALVTPNRAISFALGKALSAFVLVAAVSGFGFAVGTFAFDLAFESIGLALVWTAYSGAALVLFLIVLQTLASSQRGGNLLANFVTMPLLMIGGAFFPFEAMPDWMASIGRKVPNGWALDVLKQLLAGSLAAGDAIVAAVALLVVTGGLLLVASHRLAGPFARGA